MKKTIFLALILLGSLAGCSIALSPAVYGPPYYTGPAYLYSLPVVMAPPLIVIEPVPVVVVPVTITPSWPYYYDYGGGYGYYYPYYRYRSYGYPYYRR